jgi:agmatine deiminase
MARLGRRLAATPPDGAPPDRLGFRMPAEWEPHEATWLAWAHHREDWPSKFAAIPWIYGEIVRKLSRVERVRILVSDRDCEERARRILKKSGARMEAVEFFLCPTNRSWTRDYCPIFIRDPAGQVAITNWQFNGWSKYDNWREDDAVGAFLSRELEMREWRPEWRDRRVVLEGGSIDVNGQGALLTTEECLLSPVQARNPGLARDDLEQVLGHYLGVRKVLWLKNGIAGDDTHGHIDDLARFVDATTVVIPAEEDRREVNYEPLRENIELLRGMTDQFGRPLNVVTLPMPEPVFFDGQRLPASYANFYVANSMVLVPVFNDKSDRVALNTLARLFPDREVAGIYSGDLALGLGTIHCMTQQQPASVSGIATRKA